jgi:hypothetical protein
LQSATDVLHFVTLMPAEYAEYSVPTDDLGGQALHWQSPSAFVIDKLYPPKALVWRALLDGV